MIIEDDGVGMNSNISSTANKDRGTHVLKHGVNNMKARAHSIGAQITFESQDNRGTKIQLSFNKEAGEKNEPNG